MWIDTHCHFDFPDFDLDREAVLRQCQQLGISTLVIPAVYCGNFERVLAQQDAVVRIIPALGLHPCWLNEHPENAIDQLAQHLANPNVLAVGECGLDKFDPQWDWNKQVALFCQQLELAKQFNKPVLLHVRRAHAETIRWLKHYQLPRAGIVHAFSGSTEEAKEYAKLGFKLGVGGAFTHERAQRLRKTLQQIPLEQLVMETDAPDMAPAFALGQRNSPVNIIKIAEQLAALRSESLQRIASQTTLNALSILET